MHLYVRLPKHIIGNEGQFTEVHFFKKISLQFCACVCRLEDVCVQVRGHVGAASFLPLVAVRDPAYFRLCVLYPRRQL